MFILRGIKRLVVLALFGGLVYMASFYPVRGVPIYLVVKQYVTAKGISQGFKDLKMLFGGLLKSVGEEIQENVTDQDKRELESVIQNDLQRNSGGNLP